MLTLDPTSLFISLILSAIGFVYFSYGKKQGPYFRYTGLALMLFPYAVSDIGWLIGIGVALVALPFILNRFAPL